MRPPWPLTEQLELVRRNMLPRIRMLLRRDDYESLEDIVRRAEEECVSVASYRMPPPPDRSLFPHLAYHPPRGSARTHTAATVERRRKVGSETGADSSGGNSRGEGRLYEGTAGLAEADIEIPPLLPTNPFAGDLAMSGVAGGARSFGRIRCWNCSERGHIARECPKPRKAHCYRCGRQGCTTRTCPSCAGNSDGSR